MHLRYHLTTAELQNTEQSMRYTELLSYRQSAGLMPMQMVHVRDMSMTMPHPRMPMRVRVRFAGWIAGHVLMLVVRIVHVRMAMLHRLVLMFVLVVFGQV